MYHWLDEPRHAHETIVVPVYWITIALSALVHLVLLIFWLPHTQLLAPWDEGKELASDKLQVRLAALPPPSPPAVPAAQRAEPAPQPPRQAPPPAKVLAVAPRPRLAVPAPPSPAPALPVPPPQSAPAPTPPQMARSGPPAEGDLMSYVQARRRERGESEPSAGEDRPNLNAALAANLPRGATGVASQDKRRGGGLFELKRMNYDDAAFEFFGWNADMERKTPQMIEVRKGNNPDMRIAVVRRMIAIIREHTKEDFVWRSVRRERDFTLSARAQDNAALEEFLLQEFFDDQRQAH